MHGYTTPSTQKSYIHLKEYQQGVLKEGISWEGFTLPKR